MGAGNRSGFRDILNYLAHDENGQAWLKANLEKIPEFGRWDDLFALYNTVLEKDAMTLWANAIKEGHGLACKWADAQDIKLRSFMGMSPKAFRKLVVNGRKVVETQMCQKNWKEINYEQVPSVAIGRYNKAFYKNDKERYDAWRNSLVKVKEDGTIELTGEVKAGAIFPHDLVRTVLSAAGGQWYYGRGANNTIDPQTEKLVEGQFLSMPDYYDPTDRRILPILDFSGSMSTSVAGSIQAIDVALGLGLYCSDRVGKDNPFYRKVIPFSSGANFETWAKETFAQATLRLPRNGYCGSTNIKAALDLILKSAQMWNITKEQMPNCLLIISDMQFDMGGIDDVTPVTECLNRWIAAGYDKPAIVYWNTAGYQNQPATKFDKNIGMISGFSPSIMKAVLEGTDFSPMAIMNKALEKYVIVTP